MQRELFQPVGKKIKLEEFASNFWGYSRQRLWYRLKENRLSLAALYLAVFISLLAVVGPYFTPFKYSDQILSLSNKAPGYSFYLQYEAGEDETMRNVSVYENPPAKRENMVVEKRIFWLGSDSLGRDLFTRIWFGARISLAVGFITAVIVSFIGVLYGGVAGILGGWVDEIMMRVVEIFYSIPLLLYVILLMVLMEPGLKALFTALVAVYWLPIARLVRGQVLSLKNREYVLASRLLGAGTGRLLFKHILPNTLGPVLVYVTMTVPEVIMTEAWLSFLGLGVSAPFASWGTLINDGIQTVRSYPWQLFFPAFFLSLTILAFNFLGDGLREALNPKEEK